MPVYEYTCPACETAFEELLRSEEAAAQVTCPKSGERDVTRQPSVFAAHNTPAKRWMRPACAQCCDPEWPCPLAE